MECDTAFKSVSQSVSHEQVYHATVSQKQYLSVTNGNKSDTKCDTAMFVLHLVFFCNLHVFNKIRAVKKPPL